MLNYIYLLLKKKRKKEYIEATNIINEIMLLANLNPSPQSMISVNFIKESNN